MIVCSDMWQCRIAFSICKSEGILWHFQTCQPLLILAYKQIKSGKLSKNMNQSLPFHLILSIFWFYLKIIKHFENWMLASLHFSLLTAIVFKKVMIKKQTTSLKLFILLILKKNEHS